MMGKGGIFDGALDGEAFWFARATDFYFTKSIDEMGSRSIHSRLAGHSILQRRCDQCCP